MHKLCITIQKQLKSHRVMDYDEVWDEEEKIARKISFDDEEDEGRFELQNSISPFTKDIDLFHDGKNLTNGDGLDTENDIESAEHLSDQEKQTDEAETREIRKERYGNSDLPHDYEEIVNTGIKSEDDGMYHWKQDHDNSEFLGMGYGLNEDELVSSSSDIAGNLMEREKITIADLDKPGSYIIVARGGRGGVGNCAYAKRQFISNLLSKATEKSIGVPGEEVHLELELKLIADVGLVGFPNAGKSSLLAAMSRAQPEIAPYPFTTLHPLVGCVEYRDGFRALVADVPGLIDGASEGRGRGHDFLKHLERTKALLYIVDAAGVDGRDPIHDLTTLVEEIESYGDGDMMTRPALLVANKLDLIPDLDLREEIYFALEKVAKEKGVMLHQEVVGISAGVSGEGLGGLSKCIRGLVELGDEYRLKTNESWESYSELR